MITYQLILFLFIFVRRTKWKPIVVTSCSNSLFHQVWFMGYEIHIQLIQSKFILYIKISYNSMILINSYNLYKMHINIPHKIHNYIHLQEVYIIIMYKHFGIYQRWFLKYIFGGIHCFQIKSKWGCMNWFWTLRWSENPMMINNATKHHSSIHGITRVELTWLSPKDPVC